MLLSQQGSAKEPWSFSITCGWSADPPEENRRIKPAEVAPWGKQKKSGDSCNTVWGRRIKGNETSEPKGAAAPPVREVTEIHWGLKKWPGRNHWSTLGFLWARSVSGLHHRDGQLWGLGRLLFFSHRLQGGYVILQVEEVVLPGSSPQQPAIYGKCGEVNSSPSFSWRGAWSMNVKLKYTTASALVVMS